MMQRKELLTAIAILLLTGFILTACGSNEQVVLDGTNVICFGDSLTYGTGADRDMSYPARLSEMIDLPVINAGIPGETTAGALERLQEDVLDRDPRIVLITLGGNDLKNGVHRKSAAQNLKAIISAIQAEGAAVILGGVKFLIVDKGYGDMYRELEKETGIVLIPNILGGLIGRDEYMSDPIHPNAAGYEIMARKFHEAMEPFL